MQLLHGHDEVVRALAFSPDGTLLASGSRFSDPIRVWRLPEGTALDLGVRMCGIGPGLVFSPDGRWLAAPGDPGVRVWDTTTSRRVELTLGREGHAVHQWMHHITFSPDGQQLVVTGERNSGVNEHGNYAKQEAMIRSWQVGTWKRLPDGDFEVACDGVWRAPWALDLRQGTLATPDWKSVLFWNIHTGEKLFRLDCKSHADPGGLSFSPDGRFLAVARGRTLVSCDVVAQKPLAVWKNATMKHVQSQAFSPDGRTLATVSNDTTARFWDVQTGRQTAAFAWEIGALKAVALAADGMKAAASGDSGTIVVWDVE
jgi:hypothetical protein